MKLDPKARLPVYGSKGAAAADVHAINELSVAINPGCSAVFRTGLQFEVPEGWELKVHSRSGHGFKNGVRLSNCTGILDSDYDGELMVKLHNDSDTVYSVQPFERVCQIQLKRAPQHVFFEGEIDRETERGAGGFGSTGVVEVVGSHNHAVNVGEIPKQADGSHDHGAHFYK